MNQLNSRPTGGAGQPVGLVAPGSLGSPPRRLRSRQLGRPDLVGELNKHLCGSSIGGDRPVGRSEVPSQVAARVGIRALD